MRAAGSIDLFWGLLRSFSRRSIEPPAPADYMPPPPAKNWIAVTDSRFPHEQEALDFIHETFASHPDYFAWSNFEFIGADGSVNEVDLLVASPWGVFLIEIKSWPGKLSGDNYNWTCVTDDGRRITEDNPVLAVIHPFLGWGPTAGAHSLLWPSQSDLAATSGVTRQRIGQVIATARERWLKSVPLGGLRGAIAEVLRGRGGVMTHGELVAHVLSIRTSAENEPRKTQLAAAAVRAAVEAEHISEAPRFDEYRSGEKIFIALHSELRNYAVKLGRIADDLARLDPLATPARVLDELRAVPFPDDLPDLSPPVEARLRQLAIAAATNADLSSRGEIYLPGLPAERALPLARNGLFGDELTIKEIQRRLCARFPRCGALPPRPQLDDVLREAGFDLEWQPLAADQQGAYKSTRTSTLSSSYSIGSRKPTQFTVLPGSATDPEIAEAARIEKRLRSSATEGGYLILTVEPGQLGLAQRELTSRFDVEVCDLDELILEALHAEAEAEDVRADWDTVLAADSAARDSADWRNLQYLVERAVPKVERRLRGVRKTCLALHPGLLARYGCMNLLAGLAADIGRAGGPGGLWVLAPANDSQPLPTVSGVPIPLINGNQHARLTVAWLRNEHRAGVSLTARS